MTDERRWKLNWRWSLVSAELIALFWATHYYLIINISMPAVTSIQMSPEWTIQLPFGISYWWGILITPICFSILISLFTSHSQKKNEPYRQIGRDKSLDHGVMFGLIFGLALALAHGVMYGVAYGVAYGQALGPAIGLFYGLVYGLVYGMFSGAFLVPVFAIVFGLGSALAFGLAFRLTSGIADWLLAIDDRPVDWPLD